MIFANEWRKKLATDYPGENVLKILIYAYMYLIMYYAGESNKEISVRLGNMWKALSVPTKNKYYDSAKKADVEHKARYPGCAKAQLRLVFVYTGIVFY